MQSEVSLCSICDEERKRPLCHDLVEEKEKGSGISLLATELYTDEIADLKRYQDNSLAASTRRAYCSDYESFIGFLGSRFPHIEADEIQTQCTLEHVLAYLNGRACEKPCAVVCCMPVVFRLPVTPANTQVRVIP